MRPNRGNLLGGGSRRGRKAAGLSRRVSAGDERLLRRLGVRLMGSPSASLTSRSAPARYAQEGSCPSFYALEELAARYSPDSRSPQPAAQVLRTGEPLLRPQITDED